MGVCALKNLVVASFVDAVEDGGVGTFAVDEDLAVFTQDDRHALAHVVEVEDVEELVSRLDAELRDGDRVWSARLKTNRFKPFLNFLNSIKHVYHLENKAEVSGCRHKCVFIGRLCLVHQLSCKRQFSYFYFIVTLD